MTRRGLALLVIAVLAVLSSCSGDKGDDRDAASTTTSIAGARAATVVLRPEGTTDAATLATAATIVERRLARMGVADASVDTVAEGVRVRSSATPEQLQAAAQARATRITPGDVPTSAVTSARVVDEPGAGWRVVFAVDPAGYASLRAGITPAAPYQLVADDRVVLAFTGGVLAATSAIGPPLSEEQARAVAASLVVDDDLPVRLRSPALPPPVGSRVDVDFWTAALGVNVCGTWLPNAPAFAADTGVHSHGDGLVYIHPMNAGEAGDQATVGLFLERGGFSADGARLRLWDGVEHRTGDTCPDGRPATVTSWVNGVRHDGDPSSIVPHNGDVIVVAYGSDASPGAPPQAAELVLPRLGPEV